MNDRIVELKKLITTLDLGKMKDGNSIKKLIASKYIDIVDEDYIDTEYSTSKIVDLLSNGEVLLQVEKHCQDEDQDNGSMDMNYIEYIKIKWIEACVACQKLLDFIIGEGSSSFMHSELLQMEWISDKLSKMYAAQVIATKYSKGGSFSLQN